MACKVTLGELVFSGEKKHKIPEGMNLIGETLTVSGCGTFDVVAVELLTPDNKIVSESFVNGEYPFDALKGNPVSVTISDVLNNDAIYNLGEDEYDPDFFKEKRYPPFDKPPLDMLPITRFPKKFDWKDDNVKNLTYLSVSSTCSLCCCLLMLMLLKRK